MTRWLAVRGVQGLGLVALPLAWSACRGCPIAGPPWLGLGAAADGARAVARREPRPAAERHGWCAARPASSRSRSAGPCSRGAVCAGTRPAAVRCSSEPARAGPRAARGARRCSLAVFAGWTIVRAHDPAGAHSEQPMDLMLVSAAGARPAVPPEDPWLAGHPVGYYYFGHWLLARSDGWPASRPRSRTTSARPLATALLALGCFGVANLARAARRRRRASARAIAAGGLAAWPSRSPATCRAPLDLLQRAGLDLRGLATGRAAHNFARAGRALVVVAQQPRARRRRARRRPPRGDRRVPRVQLRARRRPRARAGAAASSLLAVALALQLLLAVREPAAGRACSRAAPARPRGRRGRRGGRRLREPGRPAGGRRSGAGRGAGAPRGRGVSALTRRSLRERRSSWPSASALMLAPFLVTAAVPGRRA